MTLSLMTFQIKSLKSGLTIQLHERKGSKDMKTIKLLLFIELVSMYNIALSENGWIKLVSWILLIFLGMAIAAKLEKRYGLD